MSVRDAYRVLGLDYDATLKDIKRAFSSLSKEFHPEENPLEYQKIYEAYKIASDWAKKGYSFSNEVGYNFLGIGNRVDYSGINPNDEKLSQEDKNNEESEFNYDEITSDIDEKLNREDKKDKESEFSFDDITSDVYESFDEDESDFENFNQIEYNQIEYIEKDDSKSSFYSFDKVPEIEKDVTKLDTQYSNIPNQPQKISNTKPFSKKSIALFAFINIIQIIIFNNIEMPTSERFIMLIVTVLFVVMIFSGYKIIRKKHSSPGSLFINSCICIVIFIVIFAITDQKPGLQGMISYTSIVFVILMLAVGSFSLIWLIISAIINKIKNKKS